MSDAHDLLDRAKHHLRRVLEAWPEPTDWDDLTIYGFYCVEAAVMAAAAHAGLSVPPSHPAKAQAASRLAGRHGLPDVSRHPRRPQRRPEGRGVRRPHAPRAGRGAGRAGDRGLRARRRTLDPPMNDPTHLLLEPRAAPAALARVRRWPSAEARAWVSDLVSDLSGRPDVHAVVAYGSAVREGVTSTDIDVLF
ncbi:MAG TPA: hypothetical protein VHG91_18115, partial [Longimicrobium sp.]|nr:hypothetical protein [Longimicrobium sp.]